MKKEAKTPKLGPRIKEIRVWRQLSQMQLAKKSGVGQSTIAQIESGRNEPALSTLAKLASSLDVELIALFRSVTPPAGVE